MRRRRSLRVRSEAGQATVEFALVLPLVAIVGWATLELGLVMRDNVLCAHAAREAARALAVGEDPVAAAQSRSGFGTELLVTVDRATGTATVELPLAPRLPLLSSVVGSASIRQQAVMRIEQPG
jgi:Flp pilus assembly protein TadG